MTSDKKTDDQIAIIMLTRGNKEQQKEAIIHLANGTLLSDLAESSMRLEAKVVDLADIIKELLARLSPSSYVAPKRFAHDDPLATRAINAIQGIRELEDVNACVCKGEDGRPLNRCNECPR